MKERLSEKDKYPSVKVESAVSGYKAILEKYIKGVKS